MPLIRATIDFAEFVLDVLQEMSRKIVQHVKEASKKFYIYSNIWISFKRVGNEIILITM